MADTLALGGLQVLFTLSLAAAAGLLAHLVLDASISTVGSLRRRRIERLFWWAKPAGPAAIRAPGQWRRALSGSPAALGALGGGLLLALAWRDPLLSPYSLLLGGAAAWLLGRERSRQKLDLREVEVTIGAVRSLIGVSHSVWGVLELVAADLPPDSPLRPLLEGAVRRYRTGTEGHTALQALGGLRWPYLDELAFVLGRVGEADTATVEQTLARLEVRVRRARHLRDRAAGVLVLSKLTLGALLAANVVAVIVSAISQPWHGFYVDGLTGRAVFVVATVLALGGAWYFDGEVRGLEEQV